MATIQIFSDLHTEFGLGHDNIRPVDMKADIVIDAGDHHPGVKGIVELVDGFSDSKLISIAGNHEFYGRRIVDSHYKKLEQKAEQLGSVFLQNNTYFYHKEDENIRVIGATLWTDFELNGDGFIAKMRAKMHLNDYNQIYGGIQRFITPEEILMEHTKSREYIRSILNTPFKGKTVIVTHHAPSRLSIPERFKFDKCNAAYASNFESWFYDYDIDLWVHGHTHDSFDYTINKTRVICNPRGYLGHELNPKFNTKLVVEI